MESLEFYQFLKVCLKLFKNNKIIRNKISHRILLTTKLFTRQKSLIKSVTKLTRVLVNVSHFQPCLVFAGKSGSLPLEWSAEAVFLVMCDPSMHEL